MRLVWFSESERGASPSNLHTLCGMPKQKELQIVTALIAAFTCAPIVNPTLWSIPCMLVPCFAFLLPLTATCRASLTTTAHPLLSTVLLSTHPRGSARTQVQFVNRSRSELNVLELLSNAGHL
jgi:hypothetical protein